MPQLIHLEKQRSDSARRSAETESADQQSRATEERYTSEAQRIIDRDAEVQSLIDDIDSLLIPEALGFLALEAE